jgi:uncharacterized membrane protein YedE/YeeE
MHHDTPFPALIGGLLIGLAAVLLLLFNGRIAGVSGVAGGLLNRGEPGKAWRWLFLLGLVLGAAGYAALGGTVAPPRQGFPPALLVLAGLLVGYGTSMAGGCTSGHGVCGLARLSLRSLVAVMVFLAVAVLTTFVTRHLLGVPA